MAKTYKRRQPKKRKPKVSDHDKIFRRKRSTSEKVMLVFGIVIAISMMASLLVNLSSQRGGF